MAFDRHQAIQWANSAEYVVSAYVNKFGELTEEEIEEFGEFPDEVDYDDQAIVEGEVVYADAEEEIESDGTDGRVDSPQEGEESGPVLEGDEQG